MADMTPTRLKRISKVPNRFSSEQSRIKITSSPGETIIDYNSNTVSTTRNVTPANKPIMLKTPTNEPFKIKLPIKRPLLSLAKDSSSSSRGQNNKQSNDSKSTSSISKNKSNKSTSILKKPAGTSMLFKSTNQTKDIAKFIEPKIVTENVFPTPPSSQDSPNCSSHSPNNITSNCSSQVQPLSTDIGSVKRKEPSQSIQPQKTELCPKRSKIDNVSQTNKKIETASNPEPQIVVNDDNCIRCPCGVNDDLGVMVECEKCHKWQHGHCINIANEDDAFDGYLCPYCVLPKDKVQESLQMLNYSDEFQTRFDVLKSQIEEGSLNSNDMSSRFTLNELYRAATDVGRIFRSLMAKWKLYQTLYYIPDIRIYQNPIWGHDATRSPRENNLYFVDNCKANLKTNIIIMATKLETRVALLEHQFTPLVKMGQLDEKNQILIDKINRTIKQFRTDLATMRASLPELQSN